MWQQLLMSAGQMCVSLVADAIRNAPIGPVESPPAPGGMSADCPACQVHAEAAEAHGVMEGMALVADPQGRVPGHVAATVRVAAACLTATAAFASDIAEARPELAEQASRAQEAARRGQAALPSRDELTSPGGAARAAAAAAVIHETWREAHGLSVAFFAPAATDQPAADRSAHTSLAA